MKYTHALLALNTLVLIGLQPQIASASTLLYDGNGLPENQTPQWLALGALNSSGIPITTFSGTAVSEGVEVDSDADGAEYAGYSNYNPLTETFINPDFPTLDFSSGYSIFFEMMLDDDSTTFSDPDDNRAAFSVTAIGTGNRGIEIGFDRDRIFAQSPDFMQVAAETQSFDTSIGTDYQLIMSGNTYQLLANTGSGFSPVINGSLREYDFNPITSQPPLDTFNPYQIPNFLFFGDNTGRAYGTFTLGEIRVETAIASTPEANFTIALALMGIGLTGKKYLQKSE